MTTAACETRDADLALLTGESVHGDFYEGQLMVRRGRISGLLDIDTAGRGERLDDAGCLLAHLAVLAEVRPDRAVVINGVGSRLDFDPGTNIVDVYVRALRCKLGADLISTIRGVGYAIDR